MPPPLSLYIHLPWCVRKCPYCDFNSHTAGSDVPFAAYTGALLTDISLAASLAGNRPLVSVFLGGGTPSLFPPHEISRVLDGVRSEFELADDVEITLEANPGTVERGDPAAYRDAGVNRLSIGAQSFDDESLKTLGRIHSPGEIVSAVEAAHAAGLDNINIDLMYGLPEQDIEAAVADIEAAASLEPAHLSWYQLTLEPSTVFYARPPAGIPGEDALFDIQQHGQARLAELGFEQDESSAYARPGRRCVHNLNYWSFGDYLAVGAGAHGKISRSGVVARYTRPANPLGYIKALENGAAMPEPKPVGPDDLVFEFMLNALRLSDGVDEVLFEARTGLEPPRLHRTMADVAARGLIAQEGDRRWRPTPLGHRFLNDLQAAFLPE